MTSATPPTAATRPADISTIVRASLATSSIEWLT